MTIPAGEYDNRTGFMEFSMNPARRFSLNASLSGGSFFGGGLNPTLQDVYRPDTEPEIVDPPREIAGDPKLPGFVLDLTEIWEPNW